MTEPTTLDTWGILEIMGHVRLAGRISEQTIGGTAFVRIDVPEIGDRPSFSKLYGAGSIYSISPTTEDIARSVAETIQADPISPYDFSPELRAVLAAARREASRPRLAADTVDQADGDQGDAEL